MQQAFQMADFSTTATTFLAALVTQLLNGAPAMSVLAEIIP
jgi:hypothetical protein